MRSLPDLLAPFVIRPLSAIQLQQVQIYLDLLLTWNARTNLTAVRDPEEIVQRHFGESFFAAQQIELDRAATVIDLGSGAGFPGLPMKIAAPTLAVTLIESQNKKATFLREVIRALGLSGITVHLGRAEEFSEKAQLVTMRAVEKFELSVGIAARLIEPDGRVALLIGADQAETARGVLSDFDWHEPVNVPASRQRIVLIGRRHQQVSS